MALNSHRPVGISQPLIPPTKPTGAKSVVAPLPATARSTPHVQDTLDLSPAAQRASPIGTSKVDFSIDSGFTHAELSGNETPAEVEFIRLLLNEETKQMVVPPELRKADESIQQIFGPHVMEQLKTNMIRKKIPSGFSAFIANLKDPSQLVEFLSQKYMSHGLVTVQENGIWKNKKVEATGFALLAASLPAESEWTPESIEAYLREYVGILAQTRVNIWVDTMQMQNFESEIQRVLDVSKKIIVSLQEKQAAMQRAVLQGAPDEQGRAKKSLEKLTRETEEALEDYAQMQTDLAMKQPTSFAANNLQKLTRAKLLEPLFMDLVKRVVYSDDDMNEHVAFVGSQLCDSKGVDVYTAHPTRAQQYIAADLTTSAHEYYEKQKKHERFVATNNDYRYDNFERFVEHVEKYSEDIMIEPWDATGNPFKFDADHIQKKVIYLDPTLWLPLLTYAIHAIKTESYEKGSGVLNVDGLEQVFRLEAQTVRGNRPWVNYASLKEYLTHLLVTPEYFAPPRDLG